MKKFLFLFLSLLINSYIFAQAAPDVTLSLSGGGSGTGQVMVNGELKTLPFTGTYKYAETVVVEAVHDKWNTFSHWSGDWQGSDNPISVILRGSKSITVNFTALQHSLYIDKSGSGTGQINVNGKLYSFPFRDNFNGGSTVTIEAVPGNGSEFTSWTGSISGKQNPTEITIDGDKAITAAFGIVKYTLTINKGGNGTGRVTVDGKEYNLPFIGQYNSGTRVSIGAVSAIGSNFTDWSGDIKDTANSTTILMNSDKTISANFLLKQYTLTLDKTGNGDGKVKVNGDLQSLPYSKQFDHGSQVSLEAVPSTGSIFNTWEGSLKVNTNPITITLTGNKNISANFSLVPRYTLQVNAGGNGSGKSKINGIIQTLPYANTYNSGEQVTIEAVPDIGSTFSQWGTDLQGNTNPDTITMTGNKTISANFSLLQYTLNIAGGGTGSGKVKINEAIQDLPFSAIFYYGTQLNIEALPAQGSTFTGWMGGLSGTINPSPISILGNTNITANFSLNPRTLNITKTGNGEGEVKVNNILHSLPYQGIFDLNTQLTIEAVPGQGCNFSGWNGDLIGNENPANIVLDKNMNINVEFIYESNGKIELVSPLNGSTGIPQNVTLNWKTNLDTAINYTYTLQLSIHESFDTLCNLGSALNSSPTNNINYFQLSDLKYKTKYFWKIMASDGVSQIYSEIWSFTTKCKPISCPLRLAAGLAGDDRIDLSWVDNSDNELNFIILRKDGDSLSNYNYQVIDTVDANITSYSDNAFQMGYKYTYMIYASNLDTVSCFSNMTTVSTLTSVNKSFAPKEFGLMQNYPNPFNPETVISYQLPVSCYVELKIYDILGNEVTTLVNGYKQPGYYNASFNAGKLSTGVYIYRLTAGKFISTKKLILIK